MNEKILLVTGASSDVGFNLIKNINNKFDYIIAHHNSDNKNLNELKEKLGKKSILMTNKIHIN